MRTIGYTTTVMNGQYVFIRNEDGHRMFATDSLQMAMTLADRLETYTGLDVRRVALYRDRHLVQPQEKEAPDADA